jgi:hypothetical protein
MRLKPEQVPDWPDSNKWVDILHWLVIVMDEEDSSRHFVAGVFAHCLKAGGITDKQAAAVEKIWERVRLAWYADELLCCQHDLENIPVRGHA